jgi:hypothetical protein
MTKNLVKTSPELLEQDERYRRFLIHLVKPADNEMMKRLDQEIYHAA